VHKALISYNKEHSSSFSSGVKMSPYILQSILPSLDEICGALRELKFGREWPKCLEKTCCRPTFSTTNLRYATVVF